MHRSVVDLADPKILRQASGPSDRSASSDPPSQKNRGCENNNSQRHLPWLRNPNPSEFVKLLAVTDNLKDPEHPVIRFVIGDNPPDASVKKGSCK